MDEDLNKLTKELTNALGSVATKLGGGEHGHVGLIVETSEYITFSNGGVRYTNPANLKAYPANPIRTPQSTNNKLLNTKRKLQSTKRTLESRSGPGERLSTPSIMSG
jgi:hypothetical protein